MRNYYCRTIFANLRFPTLRVISGVISIFSVGSLIVSLFTDTPPCWINRRASPFVAANLQHTMSFAIHILPFSSSAISRDFSKVTGITVPSTDRILPASAMAEEKLPVMRSSAVRSKLPKLWPLKPAPSFKR